MITSARESRKVVIVDFGLGNLFSVMRACEVAGLKASVSTDPVVVRGAGSVIVPGVGAFGDAMATLSRRGLDTAIKAVAASGRPVLGVCLGMQLLMSESTEFGRHLGLGLIEGQVLPLREVITIETSLKVPHVGWTPVVRSERTELGATPFDAIRNGEHFYFVHSFYAVPLHSGDSVLSATYGPLRFCAAFARGNIFGCQFHPEKSGEAGLEVYRYFARLAVGEKR